MFCGDARERSRQKAKRRLPLLFAVDSRIVLFNVLIRAVSGNPLSDSNVRWEMAVPVSSCPIVNIALLFELEGTPLG